jgi:hypothetical protein
MFWNSVLNGLSVLFHWQVWVALTLYAIAHFAWLIGVGLLMGNSYSGGRMAAGCLTNMVGGTILQAILLGLLVFFLTPIMLGGNQAMPVNLIGTFAWQIFVASFIAMVIVFILCCIPVVGGFIANTPGLSDFIQGIIIFRLFSATFIEHFLEKAGLSKDIYPGFWQSLGYFILATIFVYACLFAFAAAGTKLSRDRYSGEGTPSMFAGMIMVRLLGLVPLFMYARYASLRIQQMVN